MHECDMCGGLGGRRDVLNTPPGPRHGEGIVVCVSVALIFCGGGYGAAPAWLL